MSRQLVRDEFPKFFGFFEKTLKANGTGFFVGGSITIADLYFFGLLKRVMAGGVEHIDPSFLQAYPACLASFQNIASHPKVVEWYSAH